MQKLMKRSAALLMALVILISLVPAVALPTQAASYKYNWGTRGVVATKEHFTKSTAEEWYNVTLEDLLNNYSGASSTSSVPNSTLYKELQRIMKTAHTYQNNYDFNKNNAKYTDCQNGGGSISSFYSGKSIGPSWDGTWNREHTWPNSKGLGGKDEDDIMMIRPTSESENSSRGNTAYGESSGYYNPNSESGGKYDLRGDCARICLYVYVRWGNTSYMWGKSGVMESLSVLLKWMKEDPVDTWELGRNDSVQSMTGTRNVFVDYPELAFALFNADIPDNYQSPSGGASTPAYTISAISNNTSYGTVSLSGKTITATPKTGYYVTGYTVTSGTATVTRDGNKFTVSASSNCTIRINFAAKTSVTVSFAGTTLPDQTGFAGESMTLPAVTAPEGYTFLGWTTTAVTTDTTTKPTCYTSYTPTANITLYALYSYSVGGTGEVEYTLKNISEIKATDVVVITMEKSGTVIALPNNQSSSPDAVKVTAKDGKLTSDPGTNLLWNIKGSAGSYIFYVNGSSTNTLYCTSKNDGVNVGSSTSNTFMIDSSSGYLKHNGTNRYLGVYSNQDWRCYTSPTINIGGQTLGFYVKSVAGVTYYTGNPGLCQHLNAYYVDIQEPTCTEAGFFDGTYCPDCEEYISGGEKIPALGHEESAQVIAPTLTQGGYTLYVCPACGEEQGRGSATAALTNVEGWQLVLDNKLVVSFRLYLSNTITNTANVKITVGDETTTYTVSDLTQEGADIYCVDVPVAAAQMNDNIGIQVVNGSDATPVKNYTVRQYCDTLLADAQYSQYHALVKEMLHYGAMAQAYFGHNTGAPANQGITGTAAADLPETAPELVVADESDCLNFYGATLVYREKIAIRYYFTGDVTDCTFTANGQSLKPVERAGEYYVEFSDILPQDLDQSITVTVTDGEGNVITVTYGAMNYMVRMSQQENANLQALLKALYNYHLAAKAVG